jgi:hypothetical protein
VDSAINPERKTSSDFLDILVATHRELNNQLANPASMSANPWVPAFRGWLHAWNEAAPCGTGCALPESPDDPARRTALEISRQSSAKISFSFTPRLSQCNLPRRQGWKVQDGALNQCLADNARGDSCLGKAPIHVAARMKRSTSNANINPAVHSNPHAGNAVCFWRKETVVL